MPKVTQTISLGIVNSDPCPSSSLSLEHVENDMEAGVNAGPVSQSLKPVAIVLGVEIECGPITYALDPTPVLPSFATFSEDNGLLTLVSDNENHIALDLIEIFFEASLTEYPEVEAAMALINIGVKDFCEETILSFDQTIETMQAFVNLG